MLEEDEDEAPAACAEGCAEDHEHHSHAHAEGHAEGHPEGAAAEVAAEPKKKRKKKKHDLSDVASVGFKFPGNFDVPKFNMFMSTLLQASAG